MSDLDADLYGDLYETENAEQAEDKPTVTSSAKIPESKPKDVKTETLDTHISHEEAYSEPSPIAPSIAPPMPTQQIPTYEENPEPEGAQRTMMGGFQGGYQNYQGGAMNDRSVRPSEMKDEGKMFIGGLNWDTTDEGLRDYFSQFGKVDACTIMRDPAGRSRCFAFLTFDDPASVNKVMVQEHFLDGKIIDPKRAIPRQEHQRATKLFIGGLPGTTTSESMREFFSQFGRVVESTVMLDQKTGRSKGFGFISFEDTNVQPFLGYGNLEIDGKLIDVKLAQPRYQREGFNEDGTANANYTENRGGGGGGGFTNNFNAGGGNMAGAAAANGANAAFDPQALAALYTRMFQMANSGMGNMAMMGGMNGGGMRNPMMGGGMNPSMGGMGMGRGGGGGGGMMQGGAGIGGNIPKGPRGAPTGPSSGPSGPASVGPQRAARSGQHGYHPYARDR